jgi:hydroxyacylglutathione hydrolase
MFFQKINIPDLSINSYLIGDETTKTCLVIDPARLVTPYIMAAESAGLTITLILETHVHADFVSGASELKAQLKGKPRIYCSAMGGEEWVPAYADVKVKSKDRLEIGAVCLEAFHSPGHTPEHLMWIVYDGARNKEIPCLLFSGDCIFVGSVGRPDLLGENEFERLAKCLYQTIHSSVSELPDSLEIFPGHGAGSLCGKALGGLASTTLGYERECNPYFMPMDESRWLAMIRTGLPVIPPYFSRVKALNRSGPPLIENLKIEVIKNEKELLNKKLFILDIRHPESFARFYFEGSINIPVTASFCQWAGWLIPENQPLGIITDQANYLSETISKLRLIGFDQPIFTFTIDEETEKKALSPSCFCYLSAEEISYRLKMEKERIFILDVRTDAEWKSGHIADACHIELNQLCQKMHVLPQDRLIAVICRSGMRASSGASLLKKFGFQHVSNVKGGMQAWNQLKLPTFKA